MSHSLVHCPACKKLLRSDRPVPTGATLRCPECHAGFSAPPPLPEPTPPARLFGPLFAASVAVAVIVGGSVITAALLLSAPRGRPPEPKADDAAARRLAKEKKQLDDSRKELAEGRRRLEVAGFVADGKAALAGGKYGAAETAFNAALKLDPKDAAALEGLIAAKSGAAAERQGDEEKQKRDAERDRLLAEGREAMVAKLYARAVRVLEAARALAPADGAVLAALNDARNALEAEDAQKKNRAEHDARLAAGKTALEAGRYTDAAREFGAALALVPDSAEARDGQKAAEVKIAALNDREKTKQAVDAAIARARRAITDRRYTEALAELDGALRLIPDDREGQRLQKTTKETLDKVKASNARLLAAANVAATNGQMAEAARLAGQAAEAWPEDERAKKVLKNAERLLETGRTNQEAYLRRVQEGDFASSTGRYADAVVAYTEALRLNPTNADLAVQLRNARIALETYQRHRVEYERLLRIGGQALARNNFDEAMKAYQAARRLLPGDLAARDGISRARYGQAMLEGQQALARKQKADATAAFEAALAARPGDAAALRGLQLARLLR